MTTPATIREWLSEASKKKATHMIVACDTYDYDDYPVYVSADQNVREVCGLLDGKAMQRVIEVYDMSLSVDSQLAEPRALHL